VSTLSQTKKLNFRPGIHRESTQYAEQGSWYDGNRVRFRDKKPENIRGWDVKTSGSILGTGRDLITWQDNITQQHIAIGTEKALYLYQGTKTFNITPVRASVSLTNAFGTQANNVRVCVSDTGHGLASGDFAVFTSSSVATDFSFNAMFPVSVINANVYAFDASTSAPDTNTAAGEATVQYLIPTAASVGITGTGYGAAAYNAQVFTSVVLTSVINVVAATVAVSITSPSHNLEIDDFVYFTTATTVGGNILLTDSTFGGPIFQVVSAEDANNFTINSLVNAAGTSSGVGLATAQFLVDVSTTAGFRTWNSPAVSSAISFVPANWQLDTFGEILLSNKRGMGLNQWFPTSGGTARAFPVTNAPVSINSFVVSPNDRHVICFGCSTVAGVKDPLLVRWSDQNDYTNWTPSISSTSGENTLSGGTEIVQGIRSRNQIAILTDHVLYGMRFTGPPFIFSFTELGTGCGGVSQHGGTDMDGTPVWMGFNNFFAFDGRVRRLDCTVRRHIFSDINRSEMNKIYAGVNSEFKEITWLYPSADSTECNRYVSWSMEENYWVYGEAIWTTWSDRGVYDNVVNTGTSVGVTRIYDNEIPNTFTGKGLKIDSFIESADFGIGDGNEMLFVDRLIPDIEINNGQVSFTIQTKEFPNGQLKTKGPFNLTQNIETVRFRSRGRQARIKIENDATGTEWRYGDLRLDIQEDGLR
jgi:hypothetical protein